MLFLSVTVAFGEVITHFLAIPEILSTISFESMWPFDRSSYRKTLLKYVSPNVADAVLVDHSSSPSILELHDQLIQFAIVHIRDDNADEAVQRIESVVDLAFKKGSTVETVVFSIVIGTFGPPLDPKPNPSERCREFASELTKMHPNSIRVAFGSVQGKIGSYGHPTRMTYGSILPRFSEILSKLLQLPFGQTLEIHNP